MVHVCSLMCTHILWTYTDCSAGLSGTCPPGMSSSLVLHPLQPGLLPKVQGWEWEQFRRYYHFLCCQSCSMSVGWMPPALSCPAWGTSELRDSISSFASSCQLACYTQQRSNRSALRKVGRMSCKTNMGSLYKSLQFYFINPCAPARIPLHRPLFFLCSFPFIYDHPSPFCL